MWQIRLLCYFLNKVHRDREGLKIHTSIGLNF